jgi:hypothetical protein
LLQIVMHLIQEFSIDELKDPHIYTLSQRTSNAIMLNVLCLNVESEFSIGTTAASL